MSKGILSGMAWGAVGGTALLTVLSLYAPLPGETAESDAAPEAQEPETAAAEPETPVAGTEEAEAEPEEVAPTEVVEAEPAPEPEVAEAETPEPGPEALITAPEGATVAEVSDNAITATGQDPDVTAQAAAAPELSEEEVALSKQPAPTAPRPAGMPATPAAPTESAAAAVTAAPEEIVTRNAATAGAPLQPSSEAQPEAEDAAPARPVAEPTEEPIETAQAGQTTRPAIVFPKFDTEEPAEEPAQEEGAEADDGVTEISSDQPIILPAPEPRNPVAGVVTGRLPSVTSPASPEPEEGTEAAVATPGAGALQAFAAAVDPAPTGALFSVVLIDAGVGSGVPIEELAELQLGFSIAIDPAAAGAAERARAYRAQGIEVLTLPNDLPLDATPQDVAVAMEGYFGVIEESIGILDPLDGRIQGNRTLLQPVLGAIKETGHAMITYDKGLNSAQQAARRDGIPTATIYRLLDAEGEAAPRIKRYLDRASFNASRDGSVVVLGHSYPETVQALIEWALERSGETLSVVPISQVMLSDAG